jgi:hypothetical protein
MKDIDIKKLWGLSAGRCNHPECNVECIQFLNGGNATLIGEMAHVIAKSSKGPRAIGDSGGSDDYDNRILLCPTHHRIIDKAPDGEFPPGLLLDWKKKHEASVRLAFSIESFSDLKLLAQEINLLLQENYQAWSTYGPESEIARRNPFSSASFIWALRKLDSVVPNNKRIMELLRRHRHLFSTVDYNICTKFIEHALAFELNCYQRQDSDAVARFPLAFSELIKGLENG